jgi:hypothetical protein
MTWSIDQSPEISGAVGIDLTPVRTLYHFDTPLMFRARIGLSDVICYKLEEIGENDLYLACATDDAHVEALIAGRISLRGALDRDRYWILEANNFSSLRAWNVSRRELPEDFLPEPRVGLFARFGEVPDSLEQADAFLAFKFTGPGLVRDRISFRQFKQLVDTVHDTIHKLLTPPSLSGSRTGNLFDFTIGQPQLASLLIAVQEPTVNAEAIARRQRVPIDGVASGIREGIAAGRDEFISKVVEMNALSGSNAGYRSFIEDNYEIASALLELAPTEDSAHDAVEFTAPGLSGPEVSVVVDRSVSLNLRQAFQDVSYFSRTITGRIFLVNARGRTFVLESEDGRQVTCSLDRDTFDELQGTGDIVIGKRVTVSGAYSPRTYRAWLSVEQARFES